MITAEPFNRTGRAVLDAFLLPVDEYVARVHALQRAMRRAGLDAVTAIGHSTDAGDLAYLTGFIPILGWGAVVVGLDGDPVLVTVSGPRELAYIKSQTWINDIRTSASLFASPTESVAEVLREVLPSGGTVGVTGAASNLGSDSYQSFLQSLEPYEVRPAEVLTEDPRRRKRPRELLVLGRASDLARRAVSAAADIYASGAENADAALAAERAARLGGAHDVRVLANLYGESLSPLESVPAARRQSLSLYCAVEYCGYWGQAMTGSLASRDGTAATRAVAAMRAATSAGTSVAALAHSAIGQLPEGEGDVALAYGLGSGTGLALGEEPTISTSSKENLRIGDLLTLQTVTSEDGRLTCALETVVVTAEGAAAM